MTPSPRGLWRTRASCAGFCCEPGWRRSRNVTKRHWVRARLLCNGVRHSDWSLTRYTILEDGLTPYRKLRGREHGGAIAELGKTVPFHVQGLNQKFPRRWEKGLWMGKIRRQTWTSCGRWQAAGAHSDTKASTQEMVQGFVCAGDLYASRAEAQFATRSASTAAGVLDTRSRGKVQTHGWMQSMRAKRRLTHSRVWNQAGRMLVVGKTSTCESGCGSS